MNMRDRAPSIFQCQLNLFRQYFDKWTLNERNFMVERLESCDQQFVEEFYDRVRRSANVSWSILWFNSTLLVRARTKSSNSDARIWLQDQWLEMETKRYSMQVMTDALFANIDEQICSREWYCESTPCRAIVGSLGALRLLPCAASQPRYRKCCHSLIWALILFN